jgi:hypothetical protein
MGDTATRCAAKILCCHEHAHARLRYPIPGRRCPSCVKLLYHVDSEPAGEDVVLKHCDHVTIVVRDIERAKTFFGVLGFKQAISTVIAGEPFAS